MAYKSRSLKSVTINLRDMGKWTYRVGRFKALTEAGREKLIELVKAGATNSHIMNVLKISKRTIQRFKRDIYDEVHVVKDFNRRLLREVTYHGVRSKFELTEEGREWFISECKRGVMPYVLMRQMGVSKIVIDRLRDELGIPRMRSMNGSKFVEKIGYKYVMTAEGEEYVRKNEDRMMSRDMAKHLGVSEAWLSHYFRDRPGNSTKRNVGISLRRLAAQRCEVKTTEVKPEPEPVKPKQKRKLTAEEAKLMTIEQKRIMLGLKSKPKSEFLNGDVITEEGWRFYDRFVGRKSNKAIAEAIGVSPLRMFEQLRQRDKQMAQESMKKLSEYHYRLQVKRPHGAVVATFYINDKNKVKKYKNMYGNDYEFELYKVG